MAWQTPKTDWTAADGVRADDFNRIEENILELYNDAARTTLTTYVDWSTGNDESGLGTSASPYATINKAIESLPRNLNGLNMNVHVAPGTYAEKVNIKGFHGGTLTLISTGSVSAVTIESLTIDNSNVSISSMRLAATAAIGIVVTNFGFLLITGNVATSGDTAGINVNNGGHVYVAGTLTASNDAAVMASNVGRAYINNVSGGLWAATGGIIAYGGGNAQATTLTGGRIFSGSQGTGSLVASATVSETV